MSSRLLRILRPEQKRIWQQLAREIQGEFVAGKGWRGVDAVQTRVEDWVVVLDTVKKGKRPTKTRIRAPYVNRDSFQFKLYRRKAGSNVAKKFGLQDIEVGHKDFDDDFIIQSNDSQKVGQLLDPDRIRRLIAWQPEILLENDVDDSWMTDTWGEGKSELRFEVTGIITDLERLKDLYELFATLLNHLCHIGSAYEDDPLL